MSETTIPKDKRIPRGVVVIATLLIGVAFFSLGLMLVPAATLAQAFVSRPLLLALAVVSGVLAYGLLRLRRWAWFSTMSFLMVNGYYVVLNALTVGGTGLAGLLLLLAAAVYLLLPSVRLRFQPPRS